MSVIPTIALEVLRPSSITSTGQLEFASGPSAYSALQHPTAEYIFVVTEGGITVLDISTRSAPTVAGTVTAAIGLIGNEAIHGLAFNSTGRYLYATSGATSLYTFDLGASLINIEDPTLVDTLAISAGGNLHVLTRIDTTLWILADSANELQEIDISTPSTPSITSTTAATTIALACRSGFPNASGEYIAYPSADGSGKIGSFTVASPSSQSVFQLPTLGTGGPQIEPDTGLYFLSDDLLYLVVFYAIGSNFHYFWMALDITADIQASTPILTETVVAGVINTITAPIIATSPFNVISVGTLNSTYNDLLVFIRDDSAGKVGELQVYRANVDSTVTIGRVPRLIAAVGVPNSYSLRTGYGSDVTEIHMVGISADRANALCALATTDLLSFTDDDAFTDLTSYVLADPGVSVSAGIDGIDPTDRVASTGTMTFELDNSEINPASTLGGLSPDASAPIFSDLVIGAQARLTVDTNVMFRGVIQSIEVMPGVKEERRVRVSCVDIFNALWTRNTETIAGQTNLTIKQIIEGLLDHLPPLSGNQTIENLDFTLHTHVLGALTQEFEDYDYAFDRAYDEKTAIIGEIQKVMNSERGYFYLVPAGGVPGGYLRFQSLDESINLAVLNPVLDDDVLTGLKSTRARENLYNVITIRIFPRRVETANPGTTVLFTLQNPARIKPGETLTINAPYRDPSGLASRVGGVDMVAPVAATHYAFRTQKNGGGSNINSQLSVSAVFGGSSAKIVVTNGGPLPGFLTLMKLVGNGVYSQEPVLVTVTDSASVAIHGPSELTYDMPYTTDPNEAKALAEALLEIYANPRTFVRSIEWNPTRSSTFMTQFLAMQIGSKIAIQETMHGFTDTDYWVLGTSALGQVPAQTNLYGLSTYQVQKLSFTVMGDPKYIRARAEVIPSEPNFRPPGRISPRNWTTGEIVVPDFFQYQITNNTNALYRVVARQTADVAATTTTFVDLTGMSFTMKAGESWVFWVTSFFVSNTIADVKYTVLITDLDGVTSAAYASGRFGMWSNDAPITSGNTETFGGTINSTVATALEDVSILTGYVSAIVDCIVKIQGAQNTASGTTTFRQNSFLAAFRVSVP